MVGLFRATRKGLIRRWPVPSRQLRLGRNTNTKRSRAEKVVSVTQLTRLLCALRCDHLVPHLSHHRHFHISLLAHRPCPAPLPAHPGQPSAACRGAPFTRELLYLVPPSVLAVSRARFFSPRFLLQLIWMQQQRCIHKQLQPKSKPLPRMHPKHVDSGAPS